MHIAKMIILVGSALAGYAEASPKPPARITAAETSFSTATAEIRTWQKEKCPSSYGSKVIKVNQNECYSSSDDFLSYKLWQCSPVASTVVCTFSVYAEENCRGEAVAPVNLPRKEKDAQCADGVTAVGFGKEGSAAGIEKEGSKSYKFSCEDFGARVA